MSDNVVSHLTCDDEDDDTSKDLMKLCKQLVQHSQWKSYRRFICGSLQEIPFNAEILTMLEISTAALDIDSVEYRSFDRIAVNRAVSLPETYTGDIIRIYTDDTHIGYVRLIREKDNTEVQHSDLFEIDSSIDTKHGPAVMVDYRCRNKYWFKRNYSLMTKDDTDRIESKLYHVPFQDLVSAVHSPYWPEEATEWITRRRSRGFPSKAVIKQVVRYGCDFVQVSHNRRSNDCEWRFSFSRAELFLSKSWSISQSIIYSTLWVLNKKIASSNLCSYYFKTLMFWACEGKPTEFWRDEFLVHSICELLIEMMKCLKSKCCLNYFISDNNMMDHLTDADLSYEIDALWRIAQSRQLVTKVVDTSTICELRLANRIDHLESTAWITRGLMMYQSIHNKQDNYVELFNRAITPDLQEALYIELSDIYRGLSFQQKSVDCVNELDKHICFLKSESHMLLATNLCESQERDVLKIESIPEVKSMLDHFIPCDIEVSSRTSNANIELNTKRRSITGTQNTLNIHKEQKYLLYSRSFEKHKNNMFIASSRLSAGRTINIGVHIVTPIKPHRTNVIFYKEWPGRSPTVNISWFIAKAYLANLYYTTQSDVSLTINTCDDIIDVHKQSLTNEWFAESAFPVVLSTQWTSIYDNEIQELLGFYSLCSYVFDASSRSVYLGVCPVQFAHYLKLRLRNNHIFSADANSENNSHFNFDDRPITVCQCDPIVNNGLLTLNRAMHFYICSLLKPDIRKQN